MTVRKVVTYLPDFIVDLRCKLSGRSKNESYRMLSVKLVSHP